MGQLGVVTIPLSALPNILAGLAEHGVVVHRQPAPFWGSHGDDEDLYRCRLGHVQYVFCTCPDDAKPGRLYVLTPHCQHSLRPWRWAAEWQFSNLVDAMIAEFDDERPGQDTAAPEPGEPR